MERIKLTPTRDKDGIFKESTKFTLSTGGVFHIEFSAHDESNEEYRVCVGTRHGVTGSDIEQWFEKKIFWDNDLREYIHSHDTSDGRFSNTHLYEDFRESLVYVTKDGHHINPDYVTLTDF